MIAPLQRLRLPAGWAVEYHDFRDIDPSPEACLRSYFREDLLQLRHRDRDILIDLGWLGEETEVDGHFRVQAFLGDFHGEMLATFDTKDRGTVVQRIELMLKRLPEFPHEKQQTSMEAPPLGDAALQGLRVPPGWRVISNDFTGSDPALGQESSPSTLLLMQHEGNELFVELLGRSHPASPTESSY